MPGADLLADTLRAVALPASPDSAMRAAAAWLHERTGGGLAGAIFFGSRKTGARPGPWSAHDLLLVTCLPRRRFFDALHEAGLVRRSAALLAAVDTVLAPSVLSLRVPAGTGELHLKCPVLGVEGFVRETGPRRRDHFCMARLFQPAEIVFSGPEMEDLLLDGLVRAQRTAFEWARPSLPRSFDAEEYGRLLLRVSLASEIRPEPQGRAELLWKCQRETALPLHRLALEERLRGGEIQETAPGLYRLSHPAGWAERTRVLVYFLQYRLRSVARWFKHMITFDDWLDYIVRKAERHTGRTIDLTPRERAYPLVFLWPKVVRYLREKDRKA